jgi:hypothetical protein
MICGVPKECSVAFLSASAGFTAGRVTRLPRVMVAPERALHFAEGLYLLFFGRAKHPHGSTIPNYCMFVQCCAKNVSCVHQRSSGSAPHHDAGGATVPTNWPFLLCSEAVDFDRPLTYLLNLTK